MAKRRKNRTHLKGAAKGEEEENVPKSFVIKSGVVTKSISALVRDVRKLMEPNTASRLRERPSARLRDYLTIGPTLKVTHLLAFTLTDAANVHLRMARLPQGPTLTFRVQRYSLMRDLVHSSLRNIGKAPGGEYRHPPLLVLNGFQQPADGPAMPQLRLMSTMFQGLFPAIQVEKSALPNFRRVLLLSYHHTTHLISLRHFTIIVRPHGVSRRVRKLVNGNAAATSRRPDLSAADDIADYLLKRITSSASDGMSVGTGGYDSMSETEASEGESDTNAVELPEDYVGRGNRKGERKAVRLVETGPRMELRLIKVVEGLVGSKRGEGETVFHEFEHKTKAEASHLAKVHAEQRKIREARRAEQAANVARKKAEKAKTKGKGEPVSEEEEEEMDGHELDVEGLSGDEDPEEALQRLQRRSRAAEEDDDEFEYEDRIAGDRQDEGEDDDDEEWDEDVGADDVSSEGEDLGDESSEEEDDVPHLPAKKSVRLR
ncbi:Brix domain-domain-containing protein [Kockovaella imperatae]|uniref:Brix domain-domain-containing protein n=1 Tax=Kockovaella imperatae TaxID=4999 RepID=A0A1Y1U6H2_9TREE|nr:Brix domain-domain-containing protein [Kockovaella imperatae]ORX33629.1 Brix domain-domain-containing protein [Kockovaella imperatae]